MFQHRRVRAAALAVATVIAVPAVSIVATTSAQAGDGFEYSKGNENVGEAPQWCGGRWWD